MIPKIIHYCWFGGAPLPDKAKECIESWKKYCPNFEIKEWNETNYDVTKIVYMKQAYEEKKWAFVSDYARIDVVLQYGGIYLDTDVELIQSLEPFLEQSMFCGWEKQEANPYQRMKFYVALGLGFGAEKGNPILKDMCELYQKLSFYNSDGSLNLTACPHYQTEILEKYGLDTSIDSFQQLKYATIYPVDYFSPKSMLTGKIDITSNTVSIHHFAASWHSLKKQKWTILNQKIYNVVGINIGKKICSNVIWRMIGNLYLHGFRITVMKMWNKFLNYQK